MNMNMKINININMEIQLGTSSLIREPVHTEKFPCRRRQIQIVYI